MSERWELLNSRSMGPQLTALMVEGFVGVSSSFGWPEPASDVQSLSQQLFTLRLKWTGNIS